MCAVRRLLLLAAAVAAAAGVTSSSIPAQETPAQESLAQESLAQAPGPPEASDDGSLLEEDVVVAVPGAADALDLDQCISLALEQNAVLNAERARSGELEAQITQARAEGLPSLDAIASWDRSRDPSFALDETFGAGDEDAGLDSLFGGFILDPVEIPPQTYWRASLTASWELNPGRVWNALGAARLGVERQELTVEEIEHETVEAVMDTYYRVVLAAEQLAAVDAEMASRREFLEISRRRLRLEFGTALDTLQAAVSLANLEPQQRRTAQNLRNTGAELNVLLGRAPQAPISVEAQMQTGNASVKPGELVIEVEARPDVRQLELWKGILAKNRGAQKSLHRPRINLDGSYGYVGRDLGSLTDEGHDFWNARISLTVPIFDGFLTRGLVRETEASIRRTERELESARREAGLEVQKIAGDLEAARASLQAAQLNAIRASDALGQMTQRYELGKAAYLDVLNAQFERFSARSNLIEARYEVSRLTASFKRALGFSPARPLSEIKEVLAR